MALIIKGKIPVGKGCDECEFQTSRCEQLDACTCFLFNGCIDNFHNERHKDCPIIGEIPDNHGRLIDVDGLMKKVREEADFPSYEWSKAIECLEEAPTILEATV